LAACATDPGEASAAVAIGFQAGAFIQGTNAIAIGFNAGFTSQGSAAH
jgi:hypothetical protein